MALGASLPPGDAVSGPAGAQSRTEPSAARGGNYLLAEIGEGPMEEWGVDGANMSCQGLLEVSGSRNLSASLRHAWVLSIGHGKCHASFLVYVARKY